MVNFKSIAEKAKGVFKKQEKKEEVEKKPGDLLNEIKKYEEKISKKDYSPGVGELKEELEAGTISEESYKEVMGALGIKDEGVKTVPKAVAEQQPMADKPDVKATETSKTKSLPEEETKKQEPKKAEKPNIEAKETIKPSGVVIEPKKEEMPSERIMKAMAGGEDKFDRIIELLEEIRDLLKKEKTRKKTKNTRKSKKSIKRKR